MIDTHCHIQSVGLAEGKGEGERSTRELWAKATALTGAEVLQNAAAADVATMICVGCNLDDSRLAIEFADGAPDSCYASIGLHPHEAQHYVGDADKLQTFAGLAVEPKVVAVGECGLDYFYEHSPREAQLEILRFQFRLAAEHDLPMIFHVREAFDDFWPIFDEFHAVTPVRGVLHSYTDNAANLQLAMDRGLYIGVNGIATFAKNPAQLAVYRDIPLQKMLLETDAPFLTPTPYRGKVNEPKYLQQIANFLAELRADSLETIASATTANATALFGLK
ncbi:MAG: sec-independent protein translocase protein [Candidatus Saccharibacteria bacterium]|nr:sec-independent protein translocase protein [Candidatus Saccharibacteria bacterium]